MKIKLDENHPSQIATRLRSLRHDVQTVPEEDLSGCNDHRLWLATQREGRFLITQDLDFSDVRQFAPGTHHGIGLVRLRSPSRRSLIERTEQVFRFEDTGTWPGCFVIITEHKVRVRRGPDAKFRPPESR